MPGALRSTAALALEKYAGLSLSSTAATVTTMLMRLAVDSASFAFSEVRLGLVPAVISAVVLPRMLPHAAHRLMLTGEVFDAATAAAGGLVDLVVDDVDTAVAAQVSGLAAGAPTALAETKQLLRDRQGGLDFDPLLELSARFFAGEEGQEGIAAFREKRPACWVPVD